MMVRKSARMGAQGMRGRHEKAKSDGYDKGWGNGSRSQPPAILDRGLDFRLPVLIDLFPSGRLGRRPRRLPKELGG